MITGAAFCPHPPALIPDVAQGAAGQLDGLRGACSTAIRRVATPGATVVVIGSGGRSAIHAANVRGSLAGYGVALEVPLGAEESGPVALPLSLTVGAWLLRDALGPGCGAVGIEVGPDDPPVLPAREDRVALLVMGDGSARRSVKAPGYLDEGAAGFDAAVVEALAAGTPGGLRVDERSGGEQLAAGVPAWRHAASLLDGGNYRADMFYDEAPYGVGYFVAAWTAGDPAS